MTRTDPRSAAVTVQLTADPGPDQLAAWDRLVTATPGTDVTQLSVWARVRACAGFRAAYLFARRDGALIGGVQVMLRRVPGLGRIGYASYGPVLAAEGDERADAVQALAAGLAGLPGVRMLFVQPAEGTHDVRAALLARGFRPSSAGIAPVGSTRLDLDRSDDEIRKEFPPRLRSWTRRWPDAGVTVRIGDADDIPVLAELQRSAADARATRDRHGRSTCGRCTPSSPRTGNAALFVGEVHGVPVSRGPGDHVRDDGARPALRLRPTGPAGRLSVPGAARWEIIRWARRSGYRWLDFGGLSEQTLREVVDGQPRAATGPARTPRSSSTGASPSAIPGRSS